MVSYTDLSISPVSIHAPHEGDLIRFKPITYGYVSIHARHEGDRIRQSVSHEFGLFQSTPPHEGRLLRSAAPSPLTMFQSTPRMRGDYTLSATVRSWLCQSPRMRGDVTYSYRFIIVYPVSIMPRMRATFAVCFQWPQVGVSTTPLRGAT